MSRIYLMDAIDKHDARRFVPSKRKVCAACGEHGEFDDFASVIPAKKAKAMRAHYGGDCCIACTEAEDICDECGTIGTPQEPVRVSEFFDDFNACPDCEAQFEAAARRSY